MMTDDRELRSRQSAQFNDYDRLELPAPTYSTSILVQTLTQTTYPTATDKYFAVKAVDVAGTESEGSSAVYVAVGDIFYAALVGSSTVPGTGSYLIAESVGGRWVCQV